MFITLLFLHNSAPSLMTVSFVLPIITLGKIMNPLCSPNDHVAVFISVGGA